MLNRKMKYVMLNKYVNVNYISYLGSIKKEVNYCLVEISIKLEKYVLNWQVSEKIQPHPIKYIY